MALYIDGKIVTGWADTNYSEVTLWSGTQLCDDSNFHSLSLSDDYTNYNALIFQVIDKDNQTTNILVPVSPIELNEYYLTEIHYTSHLGAFYVFTASDTCGVARIANNNNLTYTKIIGIKYGNGTETFHNYSTAEKVVGTWVDGKTLYEKTVTFTAPNSNAYTQQSLGLTGAEVDKIWVVEGVVIKGITSSSIMGYVSSVAAEQFSGFVNKGTNVTLDYRVGASLYQGDGFVTVRYTKSSS